MKKIWLIFGLLGMLLPALADEIEEGYVEKAFAIINPEDFPDYSFYFYHQEYYYHEGYKPGRIIKTFIL